MCVPVKRIYQDIAEQSRAQLSVPPDITFSSFGSYPEAEVGRPADCTPPLGVLGGGTGLAPMLKH